jgi:hypothetical protein
VVLAVTWRLFEAWAGEGALSPGVAGRGLDHECRQDPEVASTSGASPVRRMPIGTD